MARLSDFLLRAPAERPEPVPAVPVAEAVAVLAPVDLLDVAAYAVAGAAARRGPWRGALICRWCADGDRSSHQGPDLRPARAVQRLRTAGLDAVGRRGHTVVALPAAATDCLEVIERACERADPGPLVIAVGGPRPAVFDSLIAAADGVIVACSPGADRAIAELALMRAAAPDRRGGILSLAAAGGLGATLAHGAARRAASALLATPAGSCVVAGASAEAVHAY